MKQIYLGTLTKAHGLKGSVFFNMENPDETQVKAGKEILVTTKSSTKKFIVENINTKGKRPILKLEGINSREDLDAILPAEVSMDRSDFEDLGQGEFYLNDILNFLAISEDSSEELGKVIEFYSNGAQEIVVIKGVQDWELPVDFIEEVLWDEEKIKVRKPEFL